MVYYPDRTSSGLISAGSLGDGSTIRLHWNLAYPTNPSLMVCYHIYMATSSDSVFSEGVKFVYVGNDDFADIINLTPGQLYFFAVRAVEYDQSLSDLSNLTSFIGNLKVYPQSVLTSNVSSTDSVFNLLDVSDFPPFGIIKIGVELVSYSSVDLTNNSLVLNAPLVQRGLMNTEARMHRTDGYDGYFTHSPTVSLFAGVEEQNNFISMSYSNFMHPDFAYTSTDGYHQISKDLLTTDLSASDDFNKENPSYDYAGWHRTNPVDLLTGVCVGSYIGGQMYYTDKDGQKVLVRGMNLQQQSIQRQEILLNTTGEAVTLFKRQWTGITCSCFNPLSENADDRCPKCLGTRMVIGWEQFINPNRADGKIMIRISPFEDDLKRNEAGLDPELTVDCWTTTFPTIKDRDMIVRYDQDGNEEFRYEVLSVNRNKTIVGLQGGQKFRMQKIRKFDASYQVNSLSAKQMVQGKVLLSIESSGGINPHTHQIVIPPDVTDLSKLNQITSFNAGHSHVIKFENGSLVIKESLGHFHSILP